MLLLLLLLLSRFSHVRLCATHKQQPQAPPSLGFSRQEQWSGLLFPSPMHESEKWKWGCSVVSYYLQPYGLQPTRLLRPWIFQARVLEWGAIAFSEICSIVINMCVHDFMCVCSCTCMCIDKDSLFDQTGVSLPNLLLGPLPCKI